MYFSKGPEMKNFDNPVSIGKRKVGSGYPTFIIAEAGVNHFGNIEIARHLIDMAVIARADAVKFQIFKTRNLISKVAPDWIDRMQSKELPYAAFSELSHYCQEKGIAFLATAHDEESLEFLKTLDPPAYKIGSGELSNLGFLTKIAKCQKPVVLSTGMYDMEDVREAVEIFVKDENRQLVLLHCTTCYPPMPGEINLRAIHSLEQEFGCPVGYSDHSFGTDIVMAAVALGASVIEKHIAVSKHVPNSQDCPVSCDAKDLIEMTDGIRKIEMALGSGEKKPSDREMQSRNWARKSIVAREDIKMGETIREHMLIMKRPGTGLSPKQLSLVVGYKAKRDIRKDSLIMTADLQMD
jgi:N,N'-diacetyllegionaminate synthase